MNRILTCLLCLLFYSCIASAQFTAGILTGAERTELYFPQLKDKKIGVVVNPSSIVGNKHLVDTLLKAGIKIVKIFAPEHGFRGTEDAGQLISNSVDSVTALPIVSLYGNHKKPTSEDLKNIDLMIYDLQDVGARFFTYISTLQYIMEACAENNKELMVLDRPNPNGWYVDGPVLDRKFSSFVGMQPIPIVYGMTAAEYTQMLNGEKWLKDSVQCKLSYVLCSGYTHSSLYQLPKKPSPNLPNMTAVYLYPSVCLFEGTKVSVGRGTDKPFQLIGYPEFAKGNVTFTPESVTGASNPPYLYSKCQGYDLSVYNTGFFTQRKSIILDWLITMYQFYPDRSGFFNNFFDKLAGTDRLRKDIEGLVPEYSIVQSWKPALNEFKQIRVKYLLYPDFE